MHRAQGQIYGTVLFLTLLGAGTARAEEKLLLRFAQISDTQIVDEESPARAVRAESFVKASWRPNEGYTLQTLDATLAAINAIHHGDEGAPWHAPLDFLIQTGDALELAQGNELNWFMSVMDGSDAVDPDSGNKEGGDLKPDKNNPNVSFAPNGLDQNIPWYTVYGNHDGLAVGNFKIDFHNETPSTSRAPVLAWVATLLGLTKPEVHLDSLIPTADRSPAIILANGDYVNHKDMTLNYKLLKAGTIPPDDLRAFISRRQFMAAHLRSGTMPRGHGFSVENLKTGHAYYATRPKADVPIRLIVMDTVATEQSFGEFAFDGALYTDQFENFVKKEIEDAAKNKEYVILASHHSAGRLMNKDGMVGEIEFKRYLTSQPNILAHICGHTHRNAVELVEGKYPYTEYQTSSVIDYPQQFRVFEIFQTEDGKMRITWKMSSHYENTKTETALAAESYRRSFFDQPNGGRKQKLVAILKPEETADLLESAWGLSFDGVPILSNQERLGKLTDRESSVVIDRPPL